MKRFLDGIIYQIKLGFEDVFEDDMRVISKEALEDIENKKNLLK